VEGEEISAALDPAAGVKSETVFIAGHGAGSHMSHRSMLQLSKVLCGWDLDVVRFNFPYREKGARLPDRMPKLQACFAAVVDRVRKEVPSKKLIIGGRSMGGRVASMLAAEGFRCDGLFLLAYPLHPAGRPERLRDEHLPRIRVPVLCINGAHDALCNRELMERAIGNLQWQMHWLEGEAHAFAVDEEIGAIATRWLAGL
jgi:predicted alpha/beta-hydrolase family hydrolase